MKGKKFKVIELGVVGVDSGQLMICDPCYLNEWEDKPFTDESKVKPDEFSYNSVSQMTLKKIGGQINYKLGHAGRAVAFNSGYGDGVYPVYGYLNSDGRIARVVIDMTDL